MKEEILKQIVADYEEQRNIKEKYLKIKDRINKLEQIEEVKEYLELMRITETLDYKKNINITEADMMNRAFRKKTMEITETKMNPLSRTN